MNGTPCPPAGSGVHRWLLSQANHCRWSGHTPDAAARLLRENSANCGRPVHAREIRDAVCKAYSEPGIPICFLPHWLRPSAPRWPKPNKAEIERLARTAGRADLVAGSPVRLAGAEPRTELVIDALFPRNPLLCCAWSQCSFATRLREEWRGQLQAMPFIVPSPMTAKTGRTQDGKMSAHSLDNTGPRRFLVVEFDFSIFARDGKTATEWAPLVRRLAADGIQVGDMCAAILLHLATYAPLVCAVHSGGKSLHGWFLVAGQPEDRVAAFFRYAVTIGADPALWTRSQFCRMPDGLRDNGKRQSVLFLNFKPSTAQP